MWVLTVMIFRVAGFWREDVRRMERQNELARNRNSILVNDADFGVA